MKKTTQVPEGKKLYIVTDPIKGFVQNKVIEAKRGDKVYLTEDEAKVFKDKILEI